MAVCKDKKRMQISMYKVSFDRLEELAKHEGISKSELLEHLLEQSYIEYKNKNREEYR